MNPTTLETILNISQIIIGILLIITILLQNQGAGLSSVFGGEGNIYRTKRGVEKSLFTISIILSVLFIGTAFINFIT